ncbi:alpha-hydroxy-acid oxidizing protein [Streptomyces sp. st140]|uniref:alpha-hydroxy-acid oxidizing protein n=1 Tax=Streptomyces sp. st140 TaxID=1828052 RepID=UPI0027B8B8E7|nr:alpha-hydroxy-acid oxidizing protein [Streptomyces sp. st140]
MTVGSKKSPPSSNRKKPRTGRTPSRPWTGFGRLAGENSAPVATDAGVRGFSRDLGGRGGTDFARIENCRRPLGDYGFLHDWGRSTAACLLDAQDAGLPVLASGGVRHPLGAARALALGASGVGASGVFLRTLLDGGVEALIAQITNWLDQLAALQTMLGARTPAELASKDLLIHGTLRTFCADRGIETGRLARRSRSADALHHSTGSAR